jgi:hypothetical protein
MKRIISLAICLLLSFTPYALRFTPLRACTSFIISGKATPSGKPLMFKHRDTGELNNRIAHFQGEKYAFIGLMNSPTLDGEVWSGMNEAGFCIMNTASYNLREDTLDCQMDREGELMYNALANCATIADFEAWIETYPKPWGVEANFGIIDAQGGAAYYEMNNDRYIKYDVNAEADGYRVVTNFSFAGRYEDYEGWERYQTACAEMKENFSREKEMTALDAMNIFSRQYRHEVLDLNFNKDNAPEFTVDQDFIPRRITSAVVCFEGVKAGDKPLHTIMWTALGYPACAVAVPLVMMDKTHIPHYMLARDEHAHEGSGLHSEMCDLSLQIKDQWAFPLHISNGKRYVNTQHILRGTDTAPSLLVCTQQVEKTIEESFAPLYQQWKNGQINDKQFLQTYDEIAEKWLQTYRSSFAAYLAGE